MLENTLLEKLHKKYCIYLDFSHGGYNNEDMHNRPLLFADNTIF